MSCAEPVAETAPHDPAEHGAEITRKNPAKRAAEITQRLSAALAPLELRVVDESHLHAGHAGARDGRSHFRVQITAQAFSGLRPLQRHQRIYAALGDLMRTDIHALAIEARAPDEPVARAHGSNEPAG